MDLHVPYSCHISCFLCHNWGVMLLGVSAGEENFIVPKQIIRHRLCVSRLLVLGGRGRIGRKISHSYIVVYPKPDKKVFGIYNGSLTKYFQIRQHQKNKKEEEKN